jgi:predicted ATPase
MRSALAHHDSTLRSAFTEHGGHVFKTVGDGFCVAFETAPAALQAALVARQRLDGVASENLRLRIRVALHTGIAEERDGDYFGPTLNRVARLLAIGHGDQILLSQATMELVRDALPSGASLRSCGEHHLRDLERPELVFQLLHPDIACDLTPLRSAHRAPSNLPQQLTSFIGREREIEALHGLLTRSRLVTLLGAGGSGKTRLALQVASECLDRYADGVWFTDLSALTDAALVAPTVAATLGVPDIASRTALESLIAALEHRSLLLVLDNCEHLLTPCAMLAESALRRCPGVSILATSRAALGISGETTWLIPALSLPAPGEQLSRDASMRFEGVRLFAERAAAIQPNFAVTDESAAAIVAICRQLDGIPLAIELAAARVRVLSPNQIAERLSDRFRLLADGSRLAIPRQQTLRALVDWSYELLTPSERVLLHRLAVFAGGWTLEAAEMVGAGEPLEVFEILDLLTQLVEKSLVVVEEHRNERRFRFLETLRAYALEKLQATGDEAAVRQRHLEWFTALAEETLARLSGPGQGAFFDTLELEHDNLRGALTWSEETGNGLELAARLAHALAWFWLLRGYSREGEERLVRLLGRTSDPTVARAHVLIGSGLVALQSRKFDAALEYLNEGLALARAHRQPRLVAIALTRLGLLRQAQGDFDAAWIALEESQAAFELVGGESGLDAPIAVYRAQVAKERGDLKRAMELFEDGIAVSRERGDSHGVSSALRSLAELAASRGDLERAERLFRESVQLLRDIGDKPCATLAFEWLAGIAVQQGQAERAARLFAAAAALRDETGLVTPPERGEEIQRDVARVREALDAATVAQIWAESRTMSLAQACALALDEPELRDGTE